MRKQKAETNNQKQIKYKEIKKFSIEINQQSTMIPGRWEIN